MEAESAPALPVIWQGCPHPPPRVALVSGFWGQNIGNAFFNVGGKWILQKIFGERAVEFIQDQPGYRTFHNQAKGNPRNDIVFLKELDLDYIVLQGPCLTKTFAKLWEDTFAQLTARGTGIILIGCALFKYTDDEVAAARAFLQTYPPKVLSTRDSRSYAVFKDAGFPCYDGLDSAFFAPKAYTPFRVQRRDYITFNFDRFPEPGIALTEAGAPDATFEWFGHGWALTIPHLQYWWSRRGKALAYAGHLMDFRRLPREVCGYRVVRPEHRFNPHMTYKIYQHPNAVASDEPFTYFTVYANTALTLADRVHACVATLAYGNPAMLFTPSPRSALFERVGLTDIRHRPVTLDMDWLEEERGRQLAFLTDVLQ